MSWMMFSKSFELNILHKFAEIQQVSKFWFPDKFLHGIFPLEIFSDSVVHKLLWFFGISRFEEVLEIVEDVFSIWNLKLKFCVNL